VTKLGLDGAMLFGRTRERNLDHSDFWPIFEAASALKAPLYLHPQSPLPAVRAAYYAGFGDALDSAFATFGIGWHYETGIQFMRLVLAGVFDRFPDLQVIIGHWGEVILFYLDRLESMREAGAVKLKRPVSEYVRAHAYVTPSGMLNARYRRWAAEVIGYDRLMFATDYPYLRVRSDAVSAFFYAGDLPETDRTKIASGNWERLRAEIRR
jgi:predicted TIM-barrel fold metal-dependent hydrolase